MRVAVCYIHPLAPNDGGRQRTRALCRALGELGHDVTLFTRRFPDVLELSSVEGVPVVYAGGSSTNAARSARRLLGNVRRWFFPAGSMIGARSPELARAIEEAGEFDVFLATDPPSASFFGSCRASRLWLDLSDLTSAVAVRQARELSGLRSSTARWQAKRVTRLERTLASTASAISAAGYSDFEQISKWSNDSFWAPTPVDMPRVSPDARERNRMVAGFFANFRFAPNADALELLCAEWLPGLTALGWTVAVAGYGSEELSLPPSIVNLGEVAEPFDFYKQVGLVLAPMRLGGGVKVKVMEAILAGLPILATPHSAEGLSPSLRQSIAVVDAINPDFKTALAGIQAAPTIDRSTVPFSREAFTANVAQILERVADA